MTVIIVSSFMLGYTIRGNYNEVTVKEEAKEMFLRAVAHGVETGMLTVNHTKVVEVCGGDTADTNVSDEIEGAVTNIDKNNNVIITQNNVIVK